MELTYTIPANKQEQEQHVAYPAPESGPNQFVYEYPSGKRVLVEIDLQDGKERFLRNL